MSTTAVMVLVLGVLLLGLCVGWLMGWRAACRDAERRGTERYAKECADRLDEGNRLMAAVVARMAAEPVGTPDAPSLVSCGSTSPGHARADIEIPAPPNGAVLVNLEYRYVEPRVSPWMLADLATGAGCIASLTAVKLGSKIQVRARASSDTGIFGPPSQVLAVTLPPDPRVASAAPSVAPRSSAEEGRAVARAAGDRETYDEAKERRRQRLAAEGKGDGRAE